MRGRFENKSYQAKLAFIFSCVALIIAAATIVAASLLVYNLSSSREHTIESLEELSVYMVSSTASEMTGTVNFLSTYTPVLDWIHSQVRSADYYYNSLLVYQELGRRSPLVGADPYNIAITSAGAESFVITSSGTYAKGSYAKTIGMEDGSLPQRQGTSLSSDGKTIILTLHRYLDEHTLVFYCTLPVSMIIPSESDAITWALVDDASGQMIAGNMGPTQINPAQTSGRSSQGYWSVRTEHYPFFHCTLVYAHNSIQAATIAMLILSAIAIIAFTVLFSARIQRKLYEPVRLAYESLRNSEAEDGSNEFDTIISRCREAEAISQQLEDLTNDLQTATDVMKYRSYIFGLDSPHRALDDDDAYFTLAAVITDNPDEERRMHFHLAISKIADRYSHLHYIIMDSGNGVLIYKAETEEESYSSLYNILKDCSRDSGDGSMQGAITAAALGWRSIAHSYAKSLEILDSRYAMRDKVILSEGDITSNPAQMRYPISEERKLINAALAAKGETLEIYDSIVRSNTESQISERGLKLLSSALAATVMRIFQEMRLDTNFIPDWSELVKQNKPMETIEALRATLEHLVSSYSRESDEKSSSLVDAMKAYIQLHYTEPLMLVDLSEEFNLTPKYCSEVFNRVSGDTFKNYLNQLRITKASRILEENPSVKISTLASMVGFSSSNTFIRVFEKYMGITPGQYAEHLLQQRARQSN